MANAAKIKAMEKTSARCEPPDCRNVNNASPPGGKAATKQKIPRISLSVRI